MPSIASDGVGVPGTVPRLVASRSGTVSFDGSQRSAIQVHIDRTGGVKLKSFTVQFDVEPKSDTFYEEYQVDLLSTSVGNSGFKVRMVNEGVAFPKKETELEVFFGSRVGITTEFTSQIRQDEWTTLSVVVDSNDDGEQVGMLYIDKILVCRERIKFSPDGIDYFVLGGKGFFGSLANVSIFDGAVHAKLMLPNHAEDISKTHVLVVSQGLWESRSFTDCEVRADDGTYWQAHRCILSAGSIVFARMLSSGMQESGQTSFILIRNAASVDVLALLMYLYVGRIPQRDVGCSTCWNPLAVLALADMYEVDGLSKLATIAIENDLAVDTVAEAMRTLSLMKSSKIVAPAFRRVCHRVRDDEALLERINSSDDTASLLASELFDEERHAKVDEIAKLDEAIQSLQKIQGVRKQLVDDLVTQRNELASELESLCCAAVKK